MAYDVVIDKGGKIAVVGVCEKEISGSPPWDDDAFVMRLNPSNGNILWGKRYGSRDGSHAAEIAHGIALAPTGDYYISGVWKSGSSGNMWGWIYSVKASDGSILWQKSYGGTVNPHETFSGIAKGSDGGVMVIGTTELNGGPDSDGILGIKASKSGKVGTCTPGFQAGTDGTAKSIWSSGEALNLGDQAAVLTTAGPTTFSTSNAGLTAADVCPLP